MTTVNINDFTCEKECVYDGERYSVRDNGSVLRHLRDGKRIRLDDNKWTFGKENSANPYLHISSARIHRIVATAFHGEPPDPKYVVDHIDTNCRNNRPENLRWLTRLENTLKNPVTRKKIIYLCGSIEAFLENPSMLNTLQLGPNFAWMRTVTSEEAKNCKERTSIWANTDKKSTGGSLDEWIYKPIKNSPPIGESFDVGLELTMALTRRCVQRRWRVPSYFPCCPEEIGPDPIKAYIQNLKVGAIFAYNDTYPNSIVREVVMSKDNSSILVMCEKEGVKPWSVAEITFEDGLFVHTNVGSYFDKGGADKEFCIKQGLEWLGGDTFDDFC